MQAECMCGKPIRAIEVPQDLQRLAGRLFVWKHVETDDIRCYSADYPNDPFLRDVVALPHV